MSRAATERALEADRDGQTVMSAICPPPDEIGIPLACVNMQAERSTARGGFSPPRPRQRGSAGRQSPPWPSVPNYAKCCTAELCGVANGDEATGDKLASRAHRYRACNEAA